MSWFALALLTAFLSATEAATMKKFLGDLPPLAMNAALALYTLPICLAGLFFVDMPATGPEFWTTLAVMVPLNAAGMVMHLSAINLAPLSLTMPYLAFTPVFVIVTGYLILGETVNAAGVLGILALVAGSYVLNLGALGNAGGKSRLLAPFKAVFRERGSMLMLGAALIYGLTVVLGKKIILASTPSFAALVFFLCMNLLVLAALSLAGKADFKKILARPKDGMICAVVCVFHMFCHFHAVAMAATAYMVAVKRLNGLFGVMYGGVFFKEKQIVERAAGALVMATGAAAIVIWG